MDELIPTKRKEKLPKDWSYPIGAEAISKSLETFEHIQEIELFFSWRGEYWHSKFQEKVKALGEIRIFECHNSYFSDGMSIYTYAVPANMKSEVRNAMEAEIFPKFQQWISEKYRNGRFVVHLNLKEIKLNIMEG